MSELLAQSTARDLLSKVLLVPEPTPCSSSFGWSQLAECIPFVVERHALRAVSWSHSYRLVARFEAQSLLVATSATQDAILAFYHHFCLPLSQSLLRSTGKDIRAAVTMWSRALQFEARGNFRDLTADWALMDDDTQTVALESVLEQIRRDRHQLKVAFPYEYVARLHEVDPALLCRSCGCPAVEPVMATGRGEGALYCAPCLALELGVEQLPEGAFTRDAHTQALLDSLRVRW